MPAGAPSLRACERLKVTGKVAFEAGVALEGVITIVGAKVDEPAKVIKAGTYKDTEL